MRLRPYYAEVDRAGVWLSLLHNQDNNRAAVGVYLNRYPDESWEVGVWFLFVFIGYDSVEGWELE